METKSVPNHSCFLFVFPSLGQLFLHRVFGYRGVLLFPWAAKVFDRDQQTTKAGEKFETTKPSPKSKGARNDPTKPKDSKISTMSYYQVCKNNRKDVWEHPFTFFL